MALDPHHEAKEAFLDHWSTSVFTRSSTSVEGRAPNHDRFVYIPPVAKPPKTPSKAKPRPKSAKVTIPVIMAF